MGTDVKVEGSYKLILFAGLVYIAGRDGQQTRLPG